LAHFRPLSANCHFNATTYLSIVADHVHPFVTAVFTSSDGYFQLCEKALITSNWFLEQFTILKWAPQTPDLNPVEHLWDVLGQEIHIMGVWMTNL